MNQNSIYQGKKLICQCMCLDYCDLAFEKMVDNQNVYRCTNKSLILSPEKEYTKNIKINNE